MAGELIGRAMGTLIEIGGDNCVDYRYNGRCAN